MLDTLFNFLRNAATLGLLSKCFNNLIFVSEIARTARWRQLR